MRQTTASGVRPHDSLAIRNQRGDNRIVTNEFDHNVRAEVIEGFMGTNTYEYAYDHQGRMEWKEISRKGAKTQSVTNQIETVRHSQIKRV